LGYLKRVVTDKLFRRFLLASAFAAAFVWVAVDSFNVRVEVVIQFFVMSILMVGVMVVCAFLIAWLIRLIRGKRQPLSFDQPSSDELPPDEPPPEEP
jgi:uncharacterized membrane protein